MTGHVPYYGGRFTPAQAYAASHPTGSPPRPSVPSASTAGSQADTLAALQRLLDTGVITTREYEEIRTRVVS
jgi:hypothetical protein